MLEDKQIIKLYRSGQSDLIEILIDRHKNSLYKFCYHLTSNRFDADDLFQDTWTKAVQNLEGFDESKAFGNWLFTIALNTYRDRYRKAKRWLNKFKDFFSNEEKEEELTRVPSSSPSPDEQAVENEQKNKLTQCISMLEDDFRVPIILFYYKQLKYEDIAEILGIPAGTVKSRLNAGKNKLKKLMEVDKLE